MKTNDPIVSEVRAVRDKHAAQFGYNLKEIFRDIKKKQKSSGLNMCSIRPVRLLQQLSQLQTSSDKGISRQKRKPVLQHWSKKRPMGESDYHAERWFGLYGKSTRFV